MVQPITLYDIPGNDEQSLAWSPNGWKARFSLTYKGLPHKTEWVEFPDIKPLYVKLGIPPSVPSTGSPTYTLPVIYDPNTNKYVSESAAIAEYLDQTYTETPQLFPPGTAALQTAFVEMAWPSIALPLYFSVMSATGKKLNPPSAEFFRRTREETFGKTMEELATAENWKIFEDGLGKLKSALEKENAGSDGFFLGDNITFADLQIASALIWIRVVDEVAWCKVAKLHAGTWERFLGRLAKYVVVH